MKTTRKNTTKIKITGSTLSESELFIRCEKLYGLRTARKIGDIETVNNTVLGKLNDNSLDIQYENVKDEAQAYTQQELKVNSCSSPLVLRWDIVHLPQYKVNKPLDQSGEYVDKKVADEMLEALKQAKRVIDVLTTSHGITGDIKRVEKQIEEAISKNNPLTGFIDRKGIEAKVGDTLVTINHTQEYITELTKWLEQAKPGDETSAPVGVDIVKIRNAVYDFNEKTVGDIKFKTKFHSDRYPSNNCLYIIAKKA